MPAPTSDRAPSRAAGIDRSAVEDVARILPEWLETVRHLRRQSGFQVAVWHDGELVAEVAVGAAAEPAGIPPPTSPRLRIASPSTMLTAFPIVGPEALGRPG